MNDMPTIREAQAALRTLEKFLDGFSRIFDLNQPSARELNGTDAQESPSTRQPRKGNRRPTWKTKVASILDESETPLAPAEITDRYTEIHGWNDARSKLGNRVRSTLAFMKSEGMVVANDGRYSLRKQHKLM